MFCQKKSFGTLKAVRRQILLNVIRGHSAYGFYECPHCLDFHLTSKYDNRKHDFRIMCDMFAARYKTNLRKMRKRSTEAFSKIQERAFAKTRKEIFGD